MNASHNKADGKNTARRHSRVRRAVKIVGPWRVGVSLVFGVVATVLVAWWFQFTGLLHDFPEWSYDEERIDARSVIRGILVSCIYSEASPGMKECSIYLGREEHARSSNMWVPTRDEARRPPSVFRHPVEQMVNVLADEDLSDGGRTGFRGSAEAYGFPFYCLRCWLYPEPTWIPTQNDDRVYGGSVHVAGPVLRRRNINLAVSPYWPGFFGNALFYGLPIYGIASVPNMIMGLRRRRTNRCHPCGYRLDGLTADTCPECGWRTKRKKHD